MKRGGDILSYSAKAASADSCQVLAQLRDLVIMLIEDKDRCAVGSPLERPWALLGLACKLLIALPDDLLPLTRCQLQQRHSRHVQLTANNWHWVNTGAALGVKRQNLSVCAVVGDVGIMLTRQVLCHTVRCTVATSQIRPHIAVWLKSLLQQDAPATFAAMCSRQSWMQSCKFIECQ